MVRAELVESQRPRLEVFLSPTAFLSMSVAAAEVYPKESGGVLIGLRGQDRVWVEYGVPLQTAERDEASVSWDRRVEYRIKRFMTGSTGLEVVGGFHSHPWPERKKLFKGMNQLSSRDVKSWDPREIEIVTGVVKNGGVDGNGKRLEWKHLDFGTLQGAIGAFAMKTTAWYSNDGKTKNPRIAFIRCPFATGIER